MQYHRALRCPPPLKQDNYIIVIPPPPLPPNNHTHNTPPPQISMHAHKKLTSYMSVLLKIQNTLGLFTERNLLARRQADRNLRNNFDVNYSGLFQIYLYMQYDICPQHVSITCIHIM